MITRLRLEHAVRLPDPVARPRARTGARAPVDEGFLPEEDVDRVVGKARRLWSWVPDREEEPAATGS